MLIDNPDFTINVTFLNHIIPSAAYFIKEKPSININKDALLKSKLTPGPWLQKVRDLSLNPLKEILIGDKTYKVKSLQEKLLEKKLGESIGYLTDFIFEKETNAVIKKLFKNCDNMICESQYLSSEKEFALKNYHLTAEQAARLAKSAKAKKLFLFHISDRYKIKEYPSLLKEARRIFPETFFPPEWKIKY